MKARTAVWLCAAMLAVGLGVLLPGLVFRVQDTRLESAVESQLVDTVDLSLLSELTMEQTLYIVQRHESRVELDQGRQMTADQAARAAEQEIEAVFSMIGPMGEMTVTRTVPWLYVGREGESVIFWQVELTGTSFNPAEAIYRGNMEMQRVSITVLIDEQSGRPVSLDISWPNAQEPTELYAVGVSGELDASMPADEEAAWIHLYWIFETLAEHYADELQLSTAEWAEGGSSLIIRPEQGNIFTVRLSCGWTQICFNA